MNHVASMIVTILPAGKITLEITIGAWLISMSLGAVLALSGFEGGRIVKALAGGTGMLFRSMPPLVVLYLIYYGLPSVGITLDAIWAAIVGLGILDAMYSAEYFRASFRTIPVEQWEAAFSIGLTRAGALRRVIAPQLLPFAMPPMINSFVGLMKAAVFASAIGAPELLFTSEQYMTNTGRVASVAIFVVACYIVVTVPLTRIAATLESRVRKAQR